LETMWNNRELMSEDTHMLFLSPFTSIHIRKKATSLSDFPLYIPLVYVIRSDIFDDADMLVYPSGMMLSVWKIFFLFSSLLRAVK
jgi:hypothetical protein